MADNPGNPETATFKVIGTRPVRHDGVDKVTGRARYGADYTFPGMLHGRVLRSPHAHAIIKSIDCSKALALPGVHAVVTSSRSSRAREQDRAGGRGCGRFALRIDECACAWQSPV